MERYEALIGAMKLINDARNKQDVFTPAWTMLYHAVRHLEKQADAAMRGTE